MKYFLSTLCIALFGIAIHATNAFAGTIIAVGPDVVAEVDILNVSNPGSATYHQGDALDVFATLSYYGSSSTTVTASAVTVGNTQVQLFDDPQVLNTTNAVQYSQYKHFIVNVPTDPGTGTPIAGTYQVTFDIGIPDAVPQSCNAYVRFAGVYRWGKVIWLGPAQHPAFDVTVDVYGTVYPAAPLNPTPVSVVFTIPTDGTSSGGAEIVGTAGYDHAVVRSTTLGAPCVNLQEQHYSCFVADTQVTLADGRKKNIQDIKIGDVLKGETSNNTVLGLHRPLLDGKLYSFNGGTYFVTEEHPFMTTTGWKSINPEKTMSVHIGIAVGQLRVGDTLVTDHGPVLLESIDAKDAPHSTPLYNFALSGDHTYYADGYLVHNKAQCDESNSSGSGRPCVDATTGYRIESGSGMIPAQCDYPAGPSRPFCIDSQYNSLYCPTPAGQC